MRSKPTATEAAGRGAVTGSGTGARRRLARPLYVAFVLLAGFSVSGAMCSTKEGFLTTQLKDAVNAWVDFNELQSEVVVALASPTPDLMDIGSKLKNMEDDLQQIAATSTGDTLDRAFDPGAYGYITDLKTKAEGAWTEIADLTDQFNRLGGWGVANAQHQVLTSGGTWNWVTLGTNPDLNPGGPTFTGTSPRGGNGCLPGHTFIIGVGCV